MLSRPRSGCSFRVPSVLLWSRCPDLREVVTGFWDSGGGGIELRIECSSEVLCVVVTFIQSSIFQLPFRPEEVESLVELLAVSRDLGMSSLFHQAMLAIGGGLSLRNIDSLSRLAADNGLEQLGEICRRFRSQLIDLEDEEVLLLDHNEEVLDHNEEVLENNEEVLDHNVDQNEEVYYHNEEVLLDHNEEVYYHNEEVLQEDHESSSLYLTQSVMDSLRDASQVLNRHRAAAQEEEVETTDPPPSKRRQIPPKSGGIYSLLLKDTPLPQQPVMMPGRIMGERQSKGGGGGQHKKGGRVSAGRGRGGGLAGGRRSVNDEELALPLEFRQKMSLEPEDKPTAAEKRYPPLKLI